MRVGGGEGLVALSLIRSAWREHRVVNSETSDLRGIAAGRVPKERVGGGGSGLVHGRSLPRSRTPGHHIPCTLDATPDRDERHVGAAP